MEIRWDLLASTRGRGQRPIGEEHCGWMGARKQSRIVRNSVLYSTALLCLAMTIAGCRSTRRPNLTLSVAASLQDSITEIEAAYQRDHPMEFRNNFGASGTLAREIEQGAPVDAFISAGVRPMNQLETEGLLLAGSRVDLLRNSLVLIAPTGSGLRGFDGLTEKQVRLIALGDPASVPAGQYGRQTLDTLHLYDKLKSKIVLGKDVRQVLTYVETGNADAGLVYATDAQLSDRVRVVAIAPENSHDPIVYPFAVIKTSKSQSAARQFMAFLRSPTARAIFERHGFRMA
jgi:molybdate transport system substrate-binding protein